MQFADVLDINLILYAALAVWLYGVRRWKGPWVLIGIQMALSLATELLAVHACSSGIPNASYYNVYLPIEFLLLLLIARSYVRWTHAPVIIAGIMAVYLIGMALELYGYGSIGTLGVRTAVCGALFLSGLYTYLLFRLSDQVERPLMHLPAFWLFLSFILCFGIMFPVIGLYNYLIAYQPDVADQVYTIIEVLFVVRYALAIVALLLQLRGTRA